MNQNLKTLREVENTSFISYHNINICLHLNIHDLHLNDKGGTRLAQNYKTFLSDTEFE